MPKIEMYIPKEPANFPTQLQNKFIERFGGLTVLQGVGHWESGNGGICTENVWVMLLYVPNTSDVERVEMLLQQYLEDAEQECVTFSVDGTPIYLWRQA